MSKRYMLDTAVFAAVCFAAAGLGFHPMARAGDLTSLEVDRNGTCDTAKLAAAGINLSDRGGFTYVLKPGKQLSINSGLEAKTVDRELRAFDSVNLYAQDPNSKKIFVAAGGNENRICGWADPSTPKDGMRALLIRDEQLNRNPTSDDPAGPERFAPGPKPVMVGDGPDNEKFPGNPLGLKVVITNLDVSGTEGVPIYETPDADKRGKTQNFFDIFEVFDWVELSPKKAPTHKRAGKYFLIGTMRNSALTLLGWIQDKDVYLWNNRMAVYWRADQSGAYPADASQMKIYKDPEQLKADGPPIMWGPKPGDKIDADDGVYRRYPVITTFPDEAKIEEQIKKQRLDEEEVRGKEEEVRGKIEKEDRGQIEKLVEHITISAPGQACIEGTKDCLSAQQVEEKRKDLAKKEQSVRNIDVLFVVDGTVSMEPYFKSVADAMSQFVENEFNKTQLGQSLRFGVFTYGDYKGSDTAQIDGKMDIPFEEASKEQLRSFRDLATNFKRYSLPYGDQQEDLPEASFNALILASEMKWRPDAGLRLIVHIGDHGNREYGGTSSKTNLKETVRVDEVVEALNDKKIGYIPIAVLGATGGDDAAKTRDRASYRAKFREQATKISQGVGSHHYTLKITYPEDRDEEGSGERVAGVLTALEKSVEFSTTGLEMFESHRICSQDQNSKDCITSQEKIKRHEETVLTFARDLTGLFSETETNNIYSGGRKQTVVQGVVKPFDSNSRPALNYWVVMDEPSVQNVAKVANKLCDVFSAHAGKDISEQARTLQEALYTSLNVTGGDHGSPAALLSRKLFIPYFHLSPVLSRRWSKIETILREPEQADVRKKWAERFCEKSYLLDLVYNKKRAYSTPELKELKKGKYFEAKDVRPFSWSYTGDQGLELYYVPVDYLP